METKKNAVILAHYYVNPEIQEIADYIGDSFYLSKVAVGLKEQTIVFLRRFFHGRKREDIKSKEDRADAGSDCGLCNGTYGRCRDHSEDERKI